MVATALFAAGSTCTMLFPFLSATQTARGEAITLVCSAQQAPFGPTRIVATTRFVAGSIRETLGVQTLAEYHLAAPDANPSYHLAARRQQVCRTACRLNLIRL